MKWGNFWNPWFPGTESKVRATAYFTEQMSKSSQMARHWEASTFAVDPRKAQEFKRQGWGRALNQMCLRVQKTGHRREQRWATRLRTEVKWWVCRQLPSYSAARRLEFGEWRDIRESWRKYRCCYLYLEESFSTPCWISFFDFNLCFLLLLLL